MGEIPPFSPLGDQERRDDGVASRLSQAIRQARMLKPLATSRSTTVRVRLERRLRYKRRRSLNRVAIAGCLTAAMLFTGLGWAQTGQFPRVLRTIAEILRDGIFFGSKPRPPSPSPSVAPSPRVDAERTEPLLPQTAHENGGTSRPTQRSIGAPVATHRTKSLPRSISSPHDSTIDGPMPKPTPPLADEAASLRAVLHLRGLPAAAHEALRVHRQRFPDGALAREADVIELQTDLAAGNNGEALSLLDHMDLEGTAAPYRHQVRLIHATLIGRAGRCDDALELIRDEAEPTDSLDASAFGQAFCRWAGAPDGEGQSALRGYLERFPEGRFRPLARECLTGAVTAGLLPGPVAPP